MNDSYNCWHLESAITIPKPRLADFPSRVSWLVACGEWAIKGENRDLLAMYHPQLAETNPANAFRIMRRSDTEDLFEQGWLWMPVAQFYILLNEISVA